jgi:CheY-like chemotaxis protein
VDGHDALMLAASYPHDIDVLVTDVVMPRLGARELVQRLRAERPGIRVVLMSAYVDAGAHPASNDFTDLPLLSKPFTQAALLSTITAALRAPA